MVCTSGLPSRSGSTTALPANYCSTPGKQCDESTLVARPVSVSPTKPEVFSAVQKTGDETEHSLGEKRVKTVKQPFETEETKDCTRNFSVRGILLRKWGTGGRGSDD